MRFLFGRMRFDRWLGLSVAMIMMGCNGLTYTYAMYSEYIKQKLHYSQERTDDLGAAKDFGAIFGLLSGLCYFLFPPWVSVIIGAVMHFCGYLMIFLTLTGRLMASFWLLCFASAIGAGGDNWVDTACVMTILDNFKDHKGTGVGILKSQLGLSAAIFIMVYEAFLGSKVVNFLILITFVPSVIYFGLSYFIRSYSSYEDDTDESDATQRLYMVSIFVVFLGSFLMSSTILEETVGLHGKMKAFLAIIMLLILGLMLVIPVRHKPLDCVRASLGMKLSMPNVCHPVFKDRNTMKIDSDEEPEDGEEGTLLKTIHDSSVDHSVQTTELEEEDGNGNKVTSEMTFQGDGHFPRPSLRESILGIDFWLITLVVSSGAGSGLAIINNFAQIGKAVRSNAVNAFVGIISIWSCFGRLISGYGSDLMVNAGYPRPICLLISQIAMCLCCLLLSTGTTLFLFIGSAVVGLSYGSFWTLAPTVMSEVFGLRQVATLYKLLGLGPTFASYLLSAKVLGYLYDKESLYYQQQLNVEVEANTCYGKRCFEFGLLFLASVCFVGVIACLWFAYRTKKIYVKNGPLRFPLPQ